LGKESPQALGECRSARLNGVDPKAYEHCCESRQPTRNEEPKSEEPKEEVHRTRLNHDHGQSANDESFHNFELIPDFA